MILRLFGLFEDWAEYEKPMLRYLNNVMSGNRDFKTKKAKRFVERFPEVTGLVNQTLEKPFRPKRVINSAILEAVMVTLLEHPEIGEKELSKNYKKLMTNTDFLEMTTGGTTDTAVLRGRIAVAQQTLAS